MYFNIACLCSPTGLSKKLSNNPSSTLVIVFRCKMSFCSIICSVNTSYSLWCYLKGDFLVPIVTLDIHTFFISNDHLMEAERRQFQEWDVHGQLGCWVSSGSSLVKKVLYFKDNLETLFDRWSTIQGHRWNKKVVVF